VIANPGGLVVTVTVIWLGVAVKFPTMFAGPFKVTLIGFPVLEIPPDQLLNWYPVFAFPVNCTDAPAL
jgi:hypothetical protein